MPFGVQPTFRDKWDRFVWNLKHLADDTPNPYVRNGEGDLEPKRRSAIEDITHSLKNLFVRNKQVKP